MTYTRTEHLDSNFRCFWWIDLYLLHRDCSADLPYHRRCTANSVSNNVIFKYLKSEVRSRCTFTSNDIWNGVRHGVADWSLRRETTIEVKGGDVGFYSVELKSNLVFYKYSRADDDFMIIIMDKIVHLMQLKSEENLTLQYYIIDFVENILPYNSIR